MNDEPLIGTELAGYHITSLIGRGGMGVVYRAENAVGAPVAIKVMAPEISGNRDFRERFIRESESAIEHPNIVPIFETGASGDLLYIVMFHVDGTDLKAIIETEGRLLPARAASIFIQAAAALDAAHENGIVHRDVKPQNILIEDRAKNGEHVYLTDFGLVKRASSQSSRTSSAYLLGSAFYMSPEHIEGRMIDGRADVYGLGCVLYEALTGSVPFEKENEVAVLWSHVNEDPPKVTNKVPVLSSGIDAIVAKAMAKSPDDRFLTAGEFATVVATELGAPAPRRATWAPSAVRASGAKRISGQRLRRRQRPVVAPSRSRVPALAAAVITLVGLSSFAVAGRGGDRPDGSAGFAVSDAGQRSTEGTEPVDASEKDARRLRSSRAHDGHPKTMMKPDARDPLGPLGISGREVELSTPLPLVPKGSPLAGTKIVFHHHYHDYGGGTPLEGQRHGELYMVDADGTNRKRITYDGPEQSNKYPAWSPCGDIAYNGGGSAEYAELWIMSYGTPQHRRMTQTTTIAEREPVWSPDCSRVAYSTGGTTVGPGPPVDPVSTEPGEIYVIDADGRGQTRLTDAPGADGWPSWSPDGSKIAFASTRDGDFDIYVMDVDGTHVRKLTDNSIDDIEPSWSPDGRTIAFAQSEDPDPSCMDCDAGYEIWSMSARGGRERQLTHNDDRDGAPTWSPDASRLLFYREGHGTKAFFVMRADGSGQRPWLNDMDHFERAAWQVPHPRSMSFQISGSVASGRIAAFRTACTVGQPVTIDRKNSQGWATVARTLSDAEGNFQVSVSATGRFRAHLPFFVNSSGTLCGPAYSKIF